MTHQSGSNKVSLLQSFRRNVTGIAAVEFGLLAPLLMIMLFGALEVSRGVLMHKRFQRATAMLGDLVSRESQIGKNPGEGVAALNGMLLSAAHIMQPFDMTSFNIRIMLVTDIPNGAEGPTREDWNYTSSDGNPGTAAVTCVPKALADPKMLTDNNGAIVVESSYLYKPMFANLAPSGFGASIAWTDTITHSPRQGNIIPLDLDTGSNC